MKLHENPFLESNDPVAMADYTKLNEKIESASGWYYFLLVKFSSLGCMIPAVVLTIVNYTIYDMGDESYTFCRCQLRMYLRRTLQKTKT